MILTHQDWGAIAQRNQELSDLAVAGDMVGLAALIKASDWQVEHTADYDYYAAWCRNQWGTEFQEDKPPLSLIPRKGPVLDVGFGYGFLLEALDRRNPDQPLYGIDTSEYAVQAQQKRTPAATLRVGHCAHIPWPKEHFVAIAATELVEHLSPAGGQRFYQEAHRVGAANAHLFISTRINENLGRSLMRCPHCRAVLHPAGHVRSFSKVLLFAELELGGWGVTYHEESPGGILVQCAKHS